MKKILVADDDPVMIGLYQFNLKKAGYQILVCREGASVVATMQEEKPSLAILDLMLPGRSGWELIEDITADESIAKTPLVVVTGQGKESTKEDLLKQGAASVFTKPFSPRVLLACIQELLDKAPANCS